VAIHALAEAELTFLGDQARLIILGDEIIQVVVGQEDDVAASAAVAAAGAAFGPKLLALEGDAASPAVAGAGVNFDFVNEHKKGEAGASPQRIPGAA